MILNCFEQHATGCMERGVLNFVQDGVIGKRAKLRDGHIFEYSDKCVKYIHVTSIPYALLVLYM